ncbi:MAG: MerR family transcriptional regulator [Treponema sp.]|jgi:DNA-binding transcriptional MerR regulator|nr:MerR family transcriptional regulator [Treponema sp.]
MKRRSSTEQRQASYRIGDLAKKTGVTTRTVRYYESLGLLKTQPRTNGGQRYYSDKDLVYLARIIQLKNYGLSLEEIGSIIRLGNEDASGEKRRVELVKQYRALISRNLQRIKAVQELIKELEWHMNQLETVGQEFKSCPGSACPNCEFRDRCEFVANPQLFDPRHAPPSGPGAEP